MNVRHIKRRAGAGGGTPPAPHSRWEKLPDPTRQAPRLNTGTLFITDWDIAADP
jgi:hypothetical protein